MHRHIVHLCRDLDHYTETPTILPTGGDDNDGVLRTLDAANKEFERCVEIMRSMLFRQDKDTIEYITPAGCRKIAFIATCNQNEVGCAAYILKEEALTVASEQTGFPRGILAEMTNAGIAAQHISPQQFLDMHKRLGPAATITQIGINEIGRLGTSTDMEMLFDQFAPETKSILRGEGIVIPDVPRTTEPNAYANESFDDLFDGLFDGIGFDKPKGKDLPN